MKVWFIGDSITTKPLLKELYNMHSEQFIYQDIEVEDYTNHKSNRCELCFISDINIIPSDNQSDLIV
jgi:hypothetical protein